MGSLGSNQQGQFNNGDQEYGVITPPQANLMLDSPSISLSFESYDYDGDEILFSLMDYNGISLSLDQVTDDYPSNSICNISFQENQREQLINFLRNAADTLSR